MTDLYKYTHLYTALIALLASNCVIGIDPLTAIGAAAIGAIGIFSGLHCKLTECCDDTWIVNDFKQLEHSFHNNLIGQHIAKETVLSALRGHFKKGVDPKKALAMSFHGLAGSGKTFISQLIADSMFVAKRKSKYVHFFIGRQDFTLESKADIYKIQLIDWIRGNVTLCERSLFVFDEVDKMPPRVLDAVKPFLDYHEMIGGVDYRKATFIFLSNTGSNQIAEKMKNFWERGIDRGNIKLNDFEDLIAKHAFNEAGGFHKSETIESSLIDHYVPFLPMEKSHVIACIKAEFIRRGHLSPSTSDFSAVLKAIPFGPEPHNIYASSGCKRVSPKVASVMEKMGYNRD